MIQQQNARYSGEVLLSSEKSGMVSKNVYFVKENTGVMNIENTRVYLRESHG